MNNQPQTAVAQTPPPAATPLLLSELVDDRILQLTLNRPQAYNALSYALLKDLDRVLTELTENKDIAVVILKGAGKGFCAGHDLAELQQQTTTQRRDTFELCANVMMKIHVLRQPLIAEVHGVATAAGCQLVATADLAYATPSARFATPGVNIGLFCSTPMVALTRAIGRKQAMAMLLEGEMVEAGEAKQLGLINQVYLEEHLAFQTLAMARKIRDKSRIVVQLGKQAFYKQIEMDTGLAYEYCSEVMTLNMTLKDAHNGISAFLERRSPVWSHE